MATPKMAESPDSKVITKADVTADIKAKIKEALGEDVATATNYTVIVPPVDPLYVPFGHYNDIETITKSGKFFPYWVFGLSGNGKTLSIVQAHARTGKFLLMVPITREADEDSLIGGLRLLNGNTSPFLGPVTIGALLGCTVLLDEVDLGDEKLMCLQGPLQNEPFLIKRLGKVIKPQPGFNLVATANTKGQGSEGRRFVGTNIMNEANLDRYVAVFNQEYPERDIEKQILLKVLDRHGHNTYQEIQFVDRLLDWADKIRTLYVKNGTNEVITTRRLVHICRAYDMFDKNRKKAVTLCLSRFNAQIKTSFMQFYEAIDKTFKDKEVEEDKLRKKIERGLDPELPF